ncbi:MAG TPA: acyltransferase [Candidatus Dormibacteraeota bacterium]|nr:acyltransferase [Candidatus Dormibacteraeota bacterium]
MTKERINSRGFPRERFLSGLIKRALQILVYLAPGEKSLRVSLHRLRGVRIGTNCRIGMATLIETSFPEWVSIGNHVTIGMRATIIAHAVGLPPKQYEEGEEYTSVRLEDDVFVGPGVIILPNVTIGHGAVVTAGSVVTRSIPPLTMVQGNPAKPVARCGRPLLRETPLKEFYSALKPLGQIRTEQKEERTKAAAG